MFTYRVRKPYSRFLTSAKLRSHALETLEHQLAKERSLLQAGSSEPPFFHSMPAYSRIEIRLCRGRWPAHSTLVKDA